MADSSVPAVPSSSSGLSVRQRAFVAEYMVDHNAAAAALRAGYSAKHARQMGWKLKQQAGVAGAIRDAEFDRRKRLGVDADWIVAGLVEVKEKAMVGAPRTDRDGKPISVEVDGESVMVMDWSPSGANKALELLAKHLGMTVERTEISIEGGIVYTLDLDPLGDTEPPEIVDE